MPWHQAGKDRAAGSRGNQPAGPASCPAPCGRSGSRPSGAPPSARRPCSAPLRSAHTWWSCRCPADPPPRSTSSPRWRAPPQAPAPAPRAPLGCASARVRDEGPTGANCRGLRAGRPARRPVGHVRRACIAADRPSWCTPGAELHPCRSSRRSCVRVCRSCAAASSRAAAWRPARPRATPPPRPRPAQAAGNREGCLPGQRSSFPASTRFPPRERMCARACARAGPRTRAVLLHELQPFSRQRCASATGRRRKGFEGGVFQRSYHHVQSSFAHW